MTLPDAMPRLGADAQSAKALCVFVHGRGQSPEITISDVLARLHAPHVHFALPRAPSGQWYAAKAVDPLTDVTRTELERSLLQIDEAVAEVRSSSRPDVPLLIAGFSQGACLALEYAFSRGPWNGALASLTGCRVGTTGDSRPEARLNGHSVLLTGSDSDPWIPATGFAEAALGITRAGGRLRAEAFPGRGHQVCDAEIAMLDDLLDGLAARSGDRRSAP